MGRGRGDLGGIDFIENSDNCIALCLGFSNRHFPNQCDTIKENVYIIE